MDTAEAVRYARTQIEAVRFEPVASSQTAHRPPRTRPLRAAHFTHSEDNADPLNNRRYA